jgi:acetylornithine deacetylase/succinyl-diaminopimelate desuccinylase-like protein
MIAFALALTLAQPITSDWSAIQREAVDLLQQYVRIDTSNPPGDVSKAADFLARILQKEGVAVTKYESAPGKVILLARLKGAGRAKPLLLLHHMDVVPADRTRWAEDPFGGRVRDGQVWGRGAFDMKAAGVLHLLAFLALKRHNVPLARDVIFLAVPDEEAGGLLGARWMIDRHYAELDPEYILDEGGVGSRDLFAAGKHVFGISVAEKKIMWLRIRAEGTAGHGSQPHDRNANDRLIRALGRLAAAPPPTASLPVLDTMRSRLGALADNKFMNAIQHSTTSLTSLRSGVGDPPRPNVIPSIAEATLDCRVLPGTSGEAWLAELRRRLGDPELKVEVIYESEDPVVTPDDTPLFRALAAAIVRQHPEAVVTPIPIPYGTDSNSFRPRGVKSYGLFPVTVSAEVAGSMHGDAERVPIDELAIGVRILVEAITEISR